MGIVYNNNNNKSIADPYRRIKGVERQATTIFGKGCINKTPCHQTISRTRVLKSLTSQNVQFLRSLRLRVNSLGYK